jgi:hypothetical protein
MKLQGVRVAEHGCCKVGKEVRHCRVNLSRLPDIILIAEQIDIGFRAFEEPKESVGYTQVLWLVILNKFDALASD